MAGLPYVSLAKYNYQYISLADTNIASNLAQSSVQNLDFTKKKEFTLKNSIYPSSQIRVYYETFHSSPTGYVRIMHNDEVKYDTASYGTWFGYSKDLTDCTFMPNDTISIWLKHLSGICYLRNAYLRGIGSLWANTL